MTKTCKRCFSINVVQNGKVRDKQRYKCKECGFNFVEGDSRDRTIVEVKALSLLLYGAGKMSYGMIARLFNVSRTTVLNWRRTMTKKLPEPEIPADIKYIQMDEIWHFIQKKNKEYGSGEPWIVLEIEPSDGLLAIVMLKRSESFMKN